MVSSFTVFGVTLYPYSLLMIAGALVCLALFVVVSFKRHGEAGDENLFAVEMFIVSIAAALPAAMVLDSLFKMAEKGRFEFGGATFYGGLLFALCLFPSLMLIRKNRKVPVYDRLCDVAVGIPAGHCLGRIGCFLGGCCYGVPTDCALGVVFPQGSLPFKAYGGAPVHPTQLYEAAFLLALFVFLILFCKRDAFPLYLMIYGVGRAAIECLRGDDRGSVGPIGPSPAQLISLLLIIAGGIILVVRAVRQKDDCRLHKKDGC